MGPKTSSAVYGLATIAMMQANEIEAPAKALHDLHKCLLDDKGELRLNSLLLDEKGRFVYDGWQNAAELISKQLRAQVEANGHGPDSIDAKQMAYLAAIHMICIENGHDTLPNSQAVRNLLKPPRKNLRDPRERSFITAVNHQDELDKKIEARSTEPTPEPTTPLYDKVKRQILTDSGKTEADVDARILENAITEQLGNVLADARQRGHGIAKALIAKKLTGGIDDNIVSQYMSALAVESIQGANQNEISHREKLKESYPSLPDSLQAAEAATRGGFADRAGVRTGTVTPEGAAASKPKGATELG